MAFRTIEVQLKANVAAFTGQMGVAAGSVKEFQNDILKAAAANDKFVQDMGKASLVASGALALGLGLSAKAAISFESAFAGVRKTVSGTDAELAAISDGIRDMSKELPASAVEIASVAEAAGQLGIETGSILEFSRTMVDLGETTNLTADQAATSLARLANIMGTSSSDYDRLGSTIVDLGNKSQTTEAEIVELATNLASAGAIAGLSEADVLAFAATLSSVGIEAEAGGTALRQVFSTMRDATIDGGDALEMFAETAGTTATEFARLFREDPAAAIESFIAGIARMNEAGESTTSTYEALGLNSLRLRNALDATAEAGDHLADRLEIGNRAWEENTALQTEAEQRYATTAAQLEILRNKVVDLGVDAGSVLLPAFNSVVEAAGNMADGLASLPAPVTAAATGLAAFSSVALGLVGTTIMVAPKIKQFKDGVSDMGSVAQFTGRHLRGLTLGLAGATVAVGAGVLLYERATRSSREYAEAVKEVAGMLDDVVSGQSSLNEVVNEFLSIRWRDLSEDQIDALNRIGVHMNDVEESIIAGGDALDVLRVAAQALDVDLQGVDIGNLDDQAGITTGALQNLAEAMGLSGGETKDLIESWEDLDNQLQDGAKVRLALALNQKKVTEAQMDAAVAANTAADGTVNYAAAFDELFPKTTAATSATRSHTSATEDMAAAAEKAEEALRELLDAYSAPLTPIFAMQDAMKGVDDANKAVRDSQKAFTDAQRDVIDANEAVADAHRGVAEAQRNAQRNVAAAQRDAVSAAAEIEDAQIEVAKAMSMVADEAEAARRGVADLAAEQQAAVDPLFGMLDALEKQQELLGKVSDTASRSGGRGFVPGEFEVTVSDMKEAMAGPGGRLEPGRGGTAGPSAADVAKGAADVERAAIRLAGAIQNGEVSLDDSRAMLDRWVEQGLITADQAKTVAAQFEHAARKADELQGANVRGAISSSVQAERMRVEAERTEAVAAAQQKVVEATERAAAAQERVAEAAAEGAEAIEAAQERVVDAVDAAADAKDNLADAADDVKEAEDRAARSAFELMIASIGLTGAMRLNRDMVDQAKRRWQEMADAGLITQQRADELKGAIDRATEAAGRFEGDRVMELDLDDVKFWDKVTNLQKFLTGLGKEDVVSLVLRDEALAGRFATGGYVTGANREPIYRATGGPSGTDTIPAWLSPGEYVVRAAAVNALGVDTMHRLNRAGTLSDARLPDLSGPGVMSASGTTVINNVTHETNVDIRPPEGAVRDERDLGRELHSALYTAGIT